MSTKLVEDLVKCSYYTTENQSCICFPYQFSRVGGVANQCPFFCRNIFVYHLITIFRCKNNKDPISKNREKQQKNMGY